MLTEQLFQMLTDYANAGHDDADLLTPAQVKHFIDQMLANYRFNDEYTAVAYDSDEIRRLNPVDRQILQLIYGAKRLRAKIGENDISEVDEELQEVSTEIKIPVKRGSVNEKILGREMLRAKANYFEECAHRECKERGLPPPSDLEALSMETLHARISELFRSPDKKSGPGRKASEVWARFLEDRGLQSLKERPEKHTSSLNLWLGLHGDQPLNQWTGEMAHDLRRFFFTLPQKYAQENKWKIHGGLKEIAAAFQKEIEDTPDEAAKQILQTTGTKHTTWNRHRAAFMAFWEWAKNNDFTDKQQTNPFAGLFLKTRKRRKPWKGGSEKRIHWSESAMQELFASPLFTGCKSIYRRQIPGSLVIRDALYWVVLIIAHTGMRREEICQLRVEHLCRDEAGIWFFDLKAEGLDLKDTSGEEDEEDIAAKRWVPVPDALIELGMIECLHSGRDPGEQLFRELRRYGKDKKFGTKVGSDFGRYRQHYDGTSSRGRRQVRPVIRAADGFTFFSPQYLFDPHRFRGAAGARGRGQRTQE
jgi:integrase